MSNIEYKISFKSLKQPFWVLYQSINRMIRILDSNDSIIVFRQGKIVMKDG